MVSNSVSAGSFSAKQPNIDRGILKKRPANYVSRMDEHDKIRSSDFITKTKVGIENALNTPGYAYNGMKGDPDFNFYEYLKVSKIPYFLGGATLAGVVLAARNKRNAHMLKQNSAVFKTVLSGVIMYYIGRALANFVIDAPVKLFRGVDLNHPYKNITALREGNPLNLPNNKKKCNRKVFESVEFTRWDLLYNQDKNATVNKNFDKLAKKFGAKKYDADSDSKVKGKIKELIIMANSWKYMLTAPFVTLGLGLANQEAFSKLDFKGFWGSIVDFVKPLKYSMSGSFSEKISTFSTMFKSGIFEPVKESFVSLWKGHSTASKIMGKGAIIASIALPIIANALILHKTSLRNIDNNEKGGNN